MTIEHGTTRGYRRHRDIGEDACRPCKDALAAYSRWRRQNGPDKTAGKRRWVHSKLLAEFRDAAPDWYARLSKKYGAEWDAAHQTKEMP